MRTTFLNPTVWLLLMVIVSALAGALQRRTARQSLLLVLAHATRWPVLVVLIALAAGGLASRAVIGYLSPGAYAEEVVSARAFLEERAIYGGDARAELSQWLSEERAPADAWSLPGISPCQGSAMAQRAQFFTSQAHPPTLLFASVPIVHVAGGRGLYLVLLLLAVAGLLAIVGVLLHDTGVRWRTRAGLLTVAAVTGWQPVLAAVRQGDAVLIAAALVTLSWYFARQRRRVLAGFAAGLATGLALPAIGAAAALLRSAPRAGMLAAGVIVACVAAAVAAGGPLIVPDFVTTMAFAATTYAVAPMNYAVVGRLVIGGTGIATVAAVLAIAAALSTRRAASPDGAFAAFLMLGLLAAPLVWSQHLTLAIVPLVVLLRRVLQQESPLPLAVWAALALLLSLPDPAVSALSALLARSPAASVPASVAPFGLVALWTWVIWGAGPPARQPEPAPYDIAPAAS